MPPETQEQKILRLACIAVWLGLLVVGLWPFNFFPRNRVEWLGNRNGIHFGWHGQIYTTTPWKISERQPDSSANGAFSIEIWLGFDKGFGWGTILSIYDPARPETLRINQSLTDMVLRGSFQDQNRASGFKPVWMNGIFRNRQVRFVTITSGPQGTAVYLEGVGDHLTPYSPVGDNFSGRLLLGHSGWENSAWAGTLLALAIYDRPLTADEVREHYALWSGNSVEELAKAEGIVALYPFNERAGDLVRNQAGSMTDLVIPRRFNILHRRFLADPSKLQRSDISDAAINVLGFIPFGLLVSLYFSQAMRLPRLQAIVSATVIGGMTSLLIEFLQAYLPTRDSSYLDLINNVLGTVLGAIVVERIPALRRYFARTDNSVP